jgi:endonuclease/exonuclease/phosphatase (EEP) superfamily protein YafD
MNVWAGALRYARLVVAAIVLVVGLASIVGLLDRVSWVFELADVFRLQYLVLLMAAALAALLLRRPNLATLAALLAALNIAILHVPLTPGASAASAAAAQGSLRLLVANVETGNTDFAAVDRLVARTRPDVFGVIELTPAMARHLRTHLPRYRPRALEPRDDAYGIGVYSRVPLSAHVGRYPSDSGPPTVVARTGVAGKQVSLVITHVHTPFAGSIHVRHLDTLAAARPQFGPRAVVCGDFNTPPWSGPLRDFAADSKLRDLYGDHAWSGYSWPTWSSLLRLPLDNCFVSPDVIVTNHRDGPSDGSDHRPLIVDFGIVKR